MRAAYLLLPLLYACAPPPPIDVLGALGPSIDLLYPAPGQELVLNDDCSLSEPIVVDIQGVDLVEPDPGNVVDGQGHWHGGPDLTAGYCVSFGSFCDDYSAPAVSPGLLNLSVQLQDNAHEPLEGDETGDQVEVSVVAPPGVTCP